MPKKIILLAGPTASGKSKLAIHLAKKINGEIINADSMQIYKEFSVLSSRPTKKEEREIKHHLFGFISIKKNFSAGDWLQKVKVKINLCHKKNKIPIIVGGTGLYFNTITKGISKIPNIDLRIRNKVRLLFKKLGTHNFYKELIRVDPKVNNKILPTDSQRAQRAYEVFLQTNKSIFDWILDTKSEFLNFEIKKVFLNIPREELLKKISLRIEMMFKKNCVNEVENYNKMKLNKSLSANKLIGVREIIRFQKGNMTLNECKEMINIKTRQYAKRQNTWARGHMLNWNKVYSKDFNDLLKNTLKVVS